MAGAGTPGREGTPMLTVVPDVAGALPADGQPSSLIDQIVRDGARQMLAAALRAEVAAYIGQFAGLRDEDGRRMVVRNGTAGPRTVLTSAGAVEVTAPRVNDKRTDPASGERMRFNDLNDAAFDAGKRKSMEGKTVILEGRFKRLADKEFTLFRLKMALKQLESLKRLFKVQKKEELSIYNQ